MVANALALTCGAAHRRGDLRKTTCGAVWCSAMLASCRDIGDMTTEPRIENDLHEDNRKHVKPFGSPRCRDDGFADNTASNEYRKPYRDDSQQHHPTKSEEALHK